MVKYIRGGFRLILFVVYSSWTVASILLVHWLRPSDTGYGLRRRYHWARTQLRLLGVCFTKEGSAPDFPCIIMANHRSYLDPILVLHDTVAMAVSKAEVAQWPLIGVGAKASGVIFLERESAQSRKFTLKAIREAIEQGYPVILFPEGTTHSMHQTMPFRRGGFAMAAEHHFAVVPLAVNYRYAADNWIGDDTFLPHFMQRFGEPHMEVRLAYGPVLRHTDGQVLADQCSTWINARLTEWQAEGWNQ